MKCPHLSRLPLPPELRQAGARHKDVHGKEGVVDGGDDEGVSRPDQASRGDGQLRYLLLSVVGCVVYNIMSEIKAEMGLGCGHASSLKYTLSPAAAWILRRQGGSGRLCSLW